MRRSPIEQSKAKLAKLVRGPHPGIAFKAHYIVDGDIVFEHACKLGCEGIVSKRLGSLYRSGRSPHWVKVKNPKAPAVRREAEEDWGKKRPEGLDNSEAYRRVIMGLIITLIVSVVLAVIIVWIADWTSGRPSKALETLNRRLARGEIGRAEYDEKRDLIGR